MIMILANSKHHACFFMGTYGHAGQGHVHLDYVLCTTQFYSITCSNRMKKYDMDHVDGCMA